MRKVPLIKALTTLATAPIRTHACAQLRKKCYVVYTHVKVPVLYLSLKLHLRSLDTLMPPMFMCCSLCPAIGKGLLAWAPGGGWPCRDSPGTRNPDAKPMRTRMSRLADAPVGGWVGGQ
eukprot:scaffold168970_cov16-Tisochrysis_lutea.AAC.1